MYRALEKQEMIPKGEKIESVLHILPEKLRERILEEKLDLSKVHSHKFRCTLATTTIDKRMPIEQLQRLLGH